MANNIASEIAAKVSSLPVEMQREVLRIVESFAEQSESDAAPVKRHRSLKGSLAHLKQHVSEEDIHQARREMWRGYMREDFE